ncbi:unnamed protein product [Acanthoscelides obtectus]|uniref:Uncharacterized protein n=1 Tax=Acanthoscelides obtectus TaxID=200917 RepID=A0A9P0KJA9_ACAOB|nr:unnamed protein product [Acanthoscelides obtectus]CAK1667744.1 hypothetical protein AOBTE_LOCUS26017 [Acanthoscelides obtectus]
MREKHGMFITVQNYANVSPGFNVVIGGIVVCEVVIASVVSAVVVEAEAVASVVVVAAVVVKSAVSALVVAAAVAVVDVDSVEAVAPCVDSEEGVATVEVESVGLVVPLVSVDITVVVLSPDVVCVEGAVSDFEQKEVLRIFTHLFAMLHTPGRGVVLPVTSNKTDTSSRHTYAHLYILHQVIDATFEGLEGLINRLTGVLLCSWSISTDNYSLAEEHYFSSSDALKAQDLVANEPNEEYVISSTEGSKSFGARRYQCFRSTMGRYFTRIERIDEEEPHTSTELSEPNIVPLEPPIQVTPPKRPSGYTLRLS